MKRIIIKIDGMMCSGCENRVKNRLRLINGIHNVIANHDTGDVVIFSHGDIPHDEIQSAIEDIGFSIKEWIME